MPAKISTCTNLRVVLDAAAPRGVLAAGVIAAQLGVSRAEAAARLSDAPGVLCPAADPETALRLVRTLSLFGLRVRAEAADRPPQRLAPRFDLALQRARPDGCRIEVAVVAERLGRPVRSVEEGLASPAGLILAGLDWTAVGTWRQALRAIPGLRLVVSDPGAALFDLLPSGEAAEGSHAVSLLVHLRRLGIGPCTLTGAVGAELDHAMAAHVMRRFPRAGFAPVNRDFQRFDLLLTGISGHDASDIDGFLRTRGGLCGAAPNADAAQTSADDPLRIECALGRADALAFQSDYAAIGIETRLRLVWPHAARMS